MKTVVEGDLTFEFPDDWNVIKYDDTAYYRNYLEQLGANLCAVDIVATPPPEASRLILIEVNDFRGYAVQNRKRLTSGELVAEIITKASDTISGLYLGTRGNHSEMIPFKPFLDQNLEHLEVVLFLEEDPPSANNQLRAVNEKQRLTNLNIALSGKLKAAFKSKSLVRSTSSVIARDGWQAH